jgi:23S rRNA (guanosine2251-2'-O)-methyltransferase
VLEALHAGTRHFDRLLVVKGLRNQRIADAIASASRLGVPLRFESRDTLDRMAGGVPHQGLIAVVSAKPTVDLETVLQQARQPALVVVLDGLEDPRNLGAILRSCEAAGADGVLLPERHSVGLTETVNRASAGALEHVRVGRVGNLSQAIETLKARGLWVIGFDASGTERWDAVDYKRPVALVLGGEGRGIRRLVRERCDQVVSIPLFGHVSSLNVSVAAGIALYEVVRQRGVFPSHVRPIPPGAAPPPRQIEGPRHDDTEHDPGAPPSAGRDVGEDDDLDELEHPIHVVREIDEELAWGRAVEAGATQEPRDRARQGERHAGPPHDRGREPRRDELQAAPGHASSQADAERGRGRRRRRRHRGHPQGGPRGDAGGPIGGAPPQAGNAAQPGPPNGNPPPGHPGGRRRKRWRRRGPRPPQ